MRKFSTGASRDTDKDKLSYEGFLSPLVLQRYGQYMHKHRHLPDGSLRAADNWQKGMDRDVYLDSLIRHVMDVWLAHRGHEAREDAEEALCAIIFNAMGYLYEEMSPRKDI
jgi:hypothetical protein